MSKQTKKQPTNSLKEEKGFFAWVETIGNKVPNTMILFFYLTLAIIVIAEIIYWLGVTTTATKLKNGVLVEEVLVTKNILFSLAGWDYFLNNAAKGFIQFAPLSTVMVAALGIGVAENSGLLGALIKKFVSLLPKFLLAYGVCFLGIISNIATDVGYVVLVPLAGVMFHLGGRNPFAGIVCAFAGVSAGFSANLFLGPLDALLSQLSVAAANTVDSEYSIAIHFNYYFMAVSTVFLSLIGGALTDYYIEPKLAKKFPKLNPSQPDFLQNSTLTLTSAEKKALKFTLVAFGVMVVILLIGILPEYGVLKNSDGQLISKNAKNPSPFVNGMVFIIFLLFAGLGYVYGRVVGTFERFSDVVRSMELVIKGMGVYFALIIFQSHFIGFFNYTGLSDIIANKGASFIASLNIGTQPLLVIFVFFCAFVNLFMGSASAKWTLLAPVFVPMFMNLGISPELTTLAYRIGDSTTNVITPLMTYFPIIIVTVQRYYKDVKFGTMLSTMLPYSISFLTLWTLLMIVFLQLNIPIGPNVPTQYHLG